MRIEEYPNIIFDLGGVILNIDYQKTIHAFESQGVPSFAANYSQAVQSGLFDDYETGAISSNEFRNELRNSFGVELNDSEIDVAWNAMLLDLPAKRLGLLKELGLTRRMVLLSNTNEIHIQEFGKILGNEHGIKDLSSYFEALFYSYQMGMRKPETRIFRQVIEQMNFNPNKTLFIDDSIQHVEGAKKAGINAYHLRVDQGESILDLFSDFLA